MPTIGTLTVDVQTRTSKFSSGLKTVTAGLAVMGGAAIYAFKQFEDSQKIADQTGAVIKSTGGAANVTAAQVTGLADALSKKAAIDDEVIASGENVLLTFTGIRNELGKGNDIFNQATRASLDLSVAMGQDMKSSAIQVGKALNDPISGLTSLSRIGVRFTEQQKEQIAALVESGNTLKAQKIILSELTTEFGGSAKAQATSSAQMSVALGNLAEAIGGIVAPVIQKLVGWLTTLAEWFTALPPGMQTFITAGVAVAATVALATKAFGLLSPAINIAIGAFKALTAALATNPYLLIIAATIAIAILIVKNWDTIKDFLLKVWDGIKAAAKFFWDHIAIFIMGPMKLAIDFLIDHWRGFKDVFLALWDAIRDGVGRMVGPVIATIKTIVSAIQGLIGWIQDAVEWLGKLHVPVIGGAGESRPAFRPPGLQHGGEVMRTGLALVHEGEVFSGVGGGMGTTIVNNFYGDVTGEEVVRKVRDGLLKLKARNATTGL